MPLSCENWIKIEPMVTLNGTVHLLSTKSIHNCLISLTKYKRH